MGIEANYSSGMLLKCVVVARELNTTAIKKVISNSCYNHKYKNRGW